VGSLSAADSETWAGVFFFNCMAGSGRQGLFSDLILKLDLFFQLCMLGSIF
jgi:hypothetical protein